MLSTDTITEAEKKWLDDVDGGKQSHVKPLPLPQTDNGVEVGDLAM